MSEELRCALSPDVCFFKRNSKFWRTYNCQMLDFFFSVSVGFSLEALKKREKIISSYFSVLKTHKRRMSYCFVHLEVQSVKFFC